MKGIQEIIYINTISELAQNSVVQRGFLIEMVEKNTLKFNVVFTNHIEQAHIAILPIDWNTYYTLDNKEIIKNFFESCYASNIIVLSYNPGDHGVKIPNFADHPKSIILRQSGYRSRLSLSHQGCPVFWSDPLIFMQKNQLQIRKKALSPTIGFCGQAIDSMPKRVAKPFMLCLHNLKSALGLTLEDKENWFYPPTRLRMKAIRLLQSCNKIQTNFILRAQYKAGVRIKGGDEEKTVRTEFYQNMLDSDYVLCVRGTGNFSARFYETLAIGRIPVVVETDQLWPLSDSINWNEYGLFVSQNDIKHLSERLLIFHNNLSNDDFEHLQRKCRKLWEDKLGIEEFIHHTITKVIEDSTK